MKLLGLVVLIVVPALVVVEVHRERRRGQFLHDTPTDYGHAWTIRVHRYWRHLGGPRCQVCGRTPKSWFLHGRTFQVHHIRGAGNGHRIGHEPDRDLLGVCDGGRFLLPFAHREKHNPKLTAGCHDRIHRKHHRIQRNGLDAGHKRLPGVTRRARWLGVWRRSFPTRWKVTA